MKPAGRQFVSALCGFAALFLFLLGASAHAAYPVYELSVTFAPEQNRLTGTALIRLPRPRTLTLDLAALKVAAIRVDGRPRGVPAAREVRVKAARTVEIRYSGAFDDLLDNDIHPGSIVLTESWYPSIRGMAYYRLRARLPKDYVAVSEADSVSRAEQNGMAEYRFDFPYALNDADGISFAASNRYEVQQLRHGGILLQTYLKPETAERSTALLARAAALLDDYQARFGPYPYRRLAIAEAPLTSSLSMPTQVLLDRPALKEPPDKTPTLAHEIVHQWFGDTAYIDFDSGNWAEGAAIYFADQEIEHAAERWRCRKRILIGYLNQMRGGAEPPLARFSMREDNLTRWVGYGKGAFVYHMLRREIGDEAFYGGLRGFFARYRQRVATWHDLQASFEGASHRDLGWFFRQWVEETGVAQLHPRASTRPMADGRFETRLELVQDGSPRRLAIPVTVRTAAGDETRVFRLDKGSGAFRIETAARAEAVVIDENYDVLRVLAPEERYPTIEQLQTEERLVVVLPRGDPSPYRKVIDRVRDRGKLFRLVYGPGEFPRGGRRPLTAPGRALKREWMKEADLLSAADLRNASLLVLGRDSPILARIFRNGPADPRLAGPTGGFFLEVRKNPDNPDRVVAILDSASPEDTAMGLERAEDLGGYSGFRVIGGKVAEKWTAESAHGMVVVPADGEPAQPSENHGMTIPGK
jgi:aminopeptidase N